MKHILLLTTVFWWMGQTTVWAQNDTTIAEGAAAETQLGAASMETKETAKKGVWSWG